MAAGEPCKCAGKAVAELKAKLEEKAKEAEKLRAEIQRHTLEAFQVRLQLQAAGVASAATNSGIGSDLLCPALLRSGAGAGSGIVPGVLPGGAASVGLQQFELRSLMRWLVDNVDLNRQVVFECGNGDGDVLVGGRRVRMHRMASWPMAVPGTAGSGPDMLKLSVPFEMQGEIASLLAGVRGRGNFSEVELQRFSEAWEVVGAEVVSAAAACPEPAIFLVHRETAQTIIVAQWPAVHFHWAAAAAHPMAGSFFDPARHFCAPSHRSAADAAGACTADTGVADAGATMAAGPTASITANDVTRPAVCIGDRVEVEFEGEWFSGVLQAVDGDLASVKCDVDEPAVITVAPLASVRPAPPAAGGNPPTAPPATLEVGAHATPFSEERPRLQHHARARSVG